MASGVSGGGYSGGMGSTFERAAEHHAAGRFEQAIPLYRHALRTSRGAEASRIGQMLAAALHLSGQHEQAEETLRAAIRAEPPPALGARRALATFLTRQARMSDAIAALRAGVEAARPAGGAPLGEARFALALQLSEARRADEALAELEALVAEFPAHAPVLAELGRVCDRLGRKERLREVVERLAAIAPDLPELRLLRARILASDGQLEQARAGLDALAASLHESGSARASVLAELARVLDRMGRFPEAFDAARRAQEIAWAALPPAARDASLHERVIRDCQEIRGDLFPLPGAGPGTAGPAPVFIVGFPRSGTTLLEQMLGAHPRLAVTDELPLLQRTREKMFLRFRPRGDYPRDLGAFSAEQVAQARRWYLERAANALGADRLGDRRIVDKQPLNTVDLCFVRLIFPESPVVFVRRDPRDAVLSCFMQGFTRGVPHLFTLEGTARLHRLFVQVWEHAKRELALRWLEVEYERLAADPAAEVRRVLEFIGEPWDEAVLRSHEQPHRRYVTTPSYADVTLPVHTRAIGRWRNYRDQLAPVMDELDPERKP